MSKRARQTEILAAVREHRPGSQEALREILSGKGIEVTQATLSRDIRELRLVKVPGSDGTSHYSVPDEWESTPALDSLLPTLFLSVDGVDNLLVVRTLKGAAQTVAAGIDGDDWPEVLGTLAGDDTILIVLRAREARQPLLDRIRSMAGVDDD